jgi:epoxyqueuosine reductase
MPACPTNAFVAPGVLDARRCISYLTIEHRGPIDRSLRRGIGEWLFGCDLCQTACPVNHRVERRGSEPVPMPWPSAEFDLGDLLQMDDAQFRTHFRRTALWRPRREGLLRNALIVAANARRMDLRAAVIGCLEDASPVVREAASWCLAEWGDVDARDALASAKAREELDWVRAAMQADLQRLSG